MQSRRRQKSSSSSDLLGVRNDTNHVSRSNNYENIISSTTESALSDIAESRNPGQSSQHGLEASVVDDRINASGRMTKILFVIFSLLSVFGVVMWLVQLRHNSTIISATAPNTMPSVSIPRGKSISGNFENRLDEYCSAKMPHERLQARPNAAPGGHLRTQWSSLIEPSPLVIGNWTLVYLAINIRHGDRSAVRIASTPYIRTLCIRLPECGAGNDPSQFSCITD